MNFQLDTLSKEPAYLQLYRKLVEDIVLNIYPYGGKLPSKRIIAADAGVSVITVEHAMSLLFDEGYIESRERSGYYVIYKSSEFLGQPPAGKQPAVLRSGMHRTADSLAWDMS